LGTIPLVGGQAIFTTTTLPQGRSLITARYNGDVKFAPSTTPKPLIQSVRLEEFFALGGANGRVQIQRTDPNNHGVVVSDFAPFGPSYIGPVNVAFGDIQGLGFDDLVVAAGAGNPHVKVFDGRIIHNNPNTLNPDIFLASFFPYALQFNVGANVAAGDVEDNGFADIVTGANVGNPDVRVYRGQDIANGTFNPNGASLVAQWFAYGLNFNVGAFVAVGDTNGDGYADIITGSTAGNPQVKVYDGRAIAQGAFNRSNPDAALLDEFYAYQLGQDIGTTVAAGDFEGNGRWDILTGASAGAPHYRVVRGQAAGIQPPAVNGIDAIASDLSGGVFVSA